VLQPRYQAPGRYVGIEETEDDGEPFEEKMERLTGELAGLIFEGDIWIDMIGDRNLAAYTYNEEMAKEIYDRIKDQYFERFVTFGAKMAEVTK
jgi:hypothetical protein